MNTFVTPTWVTYDVAEFWENSIKFVAQCDRSWDDSFRNKPDGAQIGYTVQARIPQRFTVTEGQALQQQAILNQTVPITINHQQNVGMGWSSADATLAVEDVTNRYTMPAGQALANKVDVTVASEFYKSVYFSATSGSIGTPISSNATYLNTVAQMQLYGIPAPYCAVLDPLSQAAIVNANLAIFNLPGRTEPFENGQFSGEALGVADWYYDPNMPTHTTGTFTASTPLVNGATQTGSTLTTDGWGTYALVAGDVFTIDGVYLSLIHI